VTNYLPIETDTVKRLQARRHLLLYAFLRVCSPTKLLTSSIAHIRGLTRTLELRPDATRSACENGPEPMVGTGPFSEEVG
jgi:hypothetical protein